ncbi:MAG: glycerol-3-phosphate acyltransferase [Chloroflexi bacterium]|jgi:acyl phosphate:glycerol-3-phosphate acyltransferase|nr:glycerol-3-phosphate acyltransferase [Chloroflexota bacterium]MDA1281506.1 glycerol-3-phosphate acyltransferase [Chloroflexota bacterium]
MDTAGLVVAMLIFGYLLGSIPFAKLFTMRAGIDLFETGTGNPGAANVFRKVDRRIGAAVFFADGLKGALPVLAAWALGVSEDFWFVGGFAAVLGHWYPVFNRFRGGAGLASGAGVAIALLPLPGLIGVTLGMLVIAKIKSSGHGALTGLVIILIAAALIDSDWPLGAEWPAMAATVALAFILFGRAAARGWKPGRKDRD